MDKSPGSRNYLGNGPQRRPVQHELLLAAVEAAFQPDSPQDHVVCYVNKVSSRTELVIIALASTTYRLYLTSAAVPQETRKEAGRLT